VLQQTVSELLMSQSLNTKIQNFDSPEYLDLLYLVQSDFLSFCNLIWNVFDSINSFISVSISIIMISMYDYKLCLFILFSLLPLAVISIFSSNESYTIKRETLSSQRELSYYETISFLKDYATEIRAYNLSEVILSKHKRTSLYLQKLIKRIKKRQSRFLIISSIIPEGVSLFLLLKIISGISLGVNSIGDFTLYQSLFSSLIAQVSLLIYNICSIYENRLKSNTIEEFTSLSNTKDDRQGQLKIDKFETVEFQHVWFKYPNKEQFVLEDFSFCFNANEISCIVGPNGSGKSTLIKLLLGYYDATYGRILINSIDIKEISKESLRENISVQFQHPMLYAATLAENIRLNSFSSATTDENIIHILKELNGTYLLEKLPSGVNTSIFQMFDNEGYEPSGGEKQIISLARCMTKRHSAIILDEPSSALDPNTELALLNYLSQNKTDNLIIYSTHRLSSCIVADNIIVLKNGHLIETGTHNNLMNKKGFYYQMNVSQSATSIKNKMI